MQPQFAMLVMAAIYVAAPSVIAAEFEDSASAVTPALQVSVSADLIARLANRPVDEVTPISLALEEGLAVGVFRLTGEIRVAPVPCGDRAVLEVATHGQSSGTMWLYRPCLRVDTVMASRVHVVQQFVISGAGLEMGWDAVSAPTSSQVYSAATRLPKHSNHAVSSMIRVGSKVMQHVQDRRATELSEAQIVREFRARAAAELATANRGFENEFLAGLATIGIPPDELRFSSASEALAMTSIRSVPSPQNSAVADQSSDLHLAVHDSFVNEVNERRLGGRTYTSADFEEAVEGFRSWLNVEQPKSSSSQSWSITLADRNPLTVTFDGNQLVLALRSKEIESAEDTLPPMDVTVRYEVQDRNGRSVLARRRPLEVYPHGFVPGSGRRLPGRVQSFRTILTRRFDRLLPRELDPEQIQPIRLPGSDRKVRVRATRLQTGDHWLWLDSGVVEAEESSSRNE
jgi:hypothetical protein